jgi:predicted DNA-binding protein (MmcQ/YjbR family)
VNIEWVRQHCLTFPNATENVQWGNDLVFKVAGKMFAVVSLEPGPYLFSFKCTPETFSDLVERPTIIPAPYLARAHWVAFQRADALPRAEIRKLLRQSYDLAFARLPKKTRESLSSVIKRNPARPT